MTFITNEDISITLSGGLNNNNPEFSLGGEPSVYPISNERLFKDVTPEEAETGSENYKCVYVNNNSFNATLYKAKIYTNYKSENSDVSVELGFREANERQNILITNSNTITGGNIKIAYIDYSGTNIITVDWNPSISVWANNFQTQLRTIENLEDIQVEGTLIENGFYFEINFLGKSSKRYHELIQLTENNLIASTEIIASITRNNSGRPINSTAQEIDATNTVPFSVVFGQYEYAESAYELGELRPGDQVPVWIKRIVPTNSRAVESDGILIKILGETSE